MSAADFGVAELTRDELAATDGGNPLIIAWYAGVITGLLLARS